MKPTRPKSDPPAAPRPVLPLTPWWNRRICVLAASVPLFLLIFSIYTGAWDSTPRASPEQPTAGQWMLVLIYGFLADGLLVAAVVLSGVTLGAAVLRLMFRSLLRDTRASLAFVTTALLGMGLISLAVLLLGLTGWLSRATGITLLLAGPVLWLVTLSMQEGFQAWWTAASRGVDRWFNAPADWGWLWLGVIPFLTLAMVGASIVPGMLWKPLDPHPFDVTAYHLQVPREWFELGRIVPIEHNVYSFFPFLTEMHYLLAMHLRGGPWAGMYAAQLFSTAFAALLVVGIYATVADQVARRGNNGRGAGTIAGVLAASVPWLTLLGSVAYVETALLAYSTAAVAWVLRAIDSDVASRARQMAVAGALAGLASGVKYTAIPTVLLLYPLIFLAIVLLARKSSRGVLSGCALFIITGVILVSPWLVRNRVWARNPVFPLAMRTLGSANYDATQIERFERAHRAAGEDAPYPHRLTFLWTRVAADWQYGYVILPAGLAAITLGFASARNRPALALLAALLLLNLAFWIAFTHLMPRFAAMLIPICAIAVGLCIVERFTSLAATVAALALVCGFYNLHLAFVRPMMQGGKSFAAMGREGLFRIDDLTLFKPPGLKEVEGTDTPVALIGHDQPFLIQMPMRQLRYRMIFDVRFPPGGNAIDAWLGAPESELRKTHVIIVDPAEIRRFSKTYFAVPSLPDTPVPPGYIVSDLPETPSWYGIKAGDGYRLVPPGTRWSDVPAVQHIWPQKRPEGRK